MKNQGSTTYFLSECRRQRRLVFRNTHYFYKRKDSFTGKDILTIYSPDKDLVVIDKKIGGEILGIRLIMEATTIFQKHFLNSEKN